jgi:hypothetical protein
MNVHLDRLQRVLSSALAGMSAEDMNWHPPGKWCAAEVLEHLYLTYTGTVKGFERVAASGHSLATAATMSQRLRTLLVVGAGYFPEGRKSPAVALPRGLPREQVLAAIVPEVKRVDDVITRCEAVLGSRKKLLDHPILGPLSANQWRKFHRVHGLHHVKQIEKLRAERSREGIAERV